MSRGTTHRTVRVDAELWDAAKAKADVEGVNLSGVIRAALRVYVESDTPTEIDVAEVAEVVYR